MGKWNILFQNWICLLLRSINLPCPTVMLSCPQNCVERKVGRSKNKLLHLCIMALSASKCISWFVISPTKRYVSLSGVKDRTSAQSMSLKDKYILKSQKLILVFHAFSKRFFVIVLFDTRKDPTGHHFTRKLTLGEVKWLIPGLV